MGVTEIALAGSLVVALLLLFSVARRLRESEAERRALADRLRESSAGGAELEAVTEATRALARSVDSDGAGLAICEAARQLSGAPVAALFEPRAGVLMARACAGAELGALQLTLTADDGVTNAFMQTENVFVVLGDGEGEADRAFMERAGLQATLWHPVILDRVPVGVLAIGWRERAVEVSERLSAVIDLIGAEAAVAIGRADLLSQLDHLARTDALTGLPNRRFWEQQLPRELARAERDDEGICVAMLDLDRFKEYNDRRGHPAGDRLLVAAALAWDETLRPYDVLARYGGEEFSVILPGCRLPDAIALVERLRGQTPDGESCSAGVAEWDGAESEASLIARADRALYEAKRAGRDRVVAASSAERQH